MAFFIITHPFGDPLKMQLTKERRIPGKVSICVGNCYLNFSGGHLHSPAPVENPGRLPHTVSVGNVVVKIKQCWNLLKMPCAAAGSLHTHIY